MNDLGYRRPLFILAFDHRSSLEKAGFKDIPELKKIIYEAFKKSLNTVKNGAILVDEQYGDLILKDAKEEDYTFALTVEKSGQSDFIFEYGEDFKAHIEKYNPTFAKVLVKVENGLSELSKINLKKLNDYCKEREQKFLIEVVSGGNVSLILKTIVEIQDFNIEPDVWKVEGMESDLDYLSIVQEAKRGGRDNVSLVILGRGESKELVEKWVKTASKISGIIGFAIGRTIFWEPINQFKSGSITRGEAIEQIGQNYIHFYNLFNE